MISPLRALPWQGFLAGWTLILIGAVLYLVGPVLLGPALLLALPELAGGNITLLIAAAVVFGFRFSGTWAFPLLTKVTPGLGLIWFAVRREWRGLAIAVVTTVGIVVVSFVSSAPNDWVDWFRVLIGNAGAPIDSGSLPVPLWFRLPIAFIVVIWAARTDRRWLLAVGCLLALPVIWYGSLTLLIAVVPLARPDWTYYPWRETAINARVAIRTRLGVRPTQSAQYTANAATVRASAGPAGRSALPRTGRRPCATRSTIVRTVQRSGRSFGSSSSSQAIGALTGAPGAGRTA